MKRAQKYRSLSCNDCNRKFCLDYELPTCKGAKEEDVYTTCFRKWFAGPVDQPRGSELDSIRDVLTGSYDIRARFTERRGGSVYFHFCYRWTAGLGCLQAMDWAICWGRPMPIWYIFVDNVLTDLGCTRTQVVYTRCWTRSLNNEFEIICWDISKVPQKRKKEQR